MKYHVSGVKPNIVTEQEQFYLDGELITESYRDYTRKELHKEFTSLDDFLKKWNEADRKLEIIEELEKHAVIFENLAESVGKNFDVFDLICHIAFDQPPLTRQERRDNVKKRNYFTKYGEPARAVLDALLDKYADEGIQSLESPKILKLDPFKHMGTPVEIISGIFGGKDQYMNAIKELEQALYDNGQRA